MKALLCLFAGHLWLIHWTDRPRRDGSWVMACSRCGTVKTDSVTFRAKP